MTTETEPLAASPAELVTRVMAGDAGAEVALVHRYSRPLRAVLRQRLSQNDDVDDFLQDTLSLAIVKVRAGKVRDPDRLGAFLMSMARNLVIEHFRRAARRQTEADSERVERQAEVESVPGTEARLLAMERASLVRDMLEDLETSRDRDVLRRFYLEDEDKMSICRDLELSSLHFNRVLHRARQRYRGVVEDRLGTRWRGSSREKTG